MTSFRESTAMSSSPDSMSLLTVRLSVHRTMAAAHALQRSRSDWHSCSIESIIVSTQSDFHLGAQYALQSGCQEAASGTGTGSDPVDCPEAID
jgi:hypothetical protein